MRVFGLNKHKHQDVLIDKTRLIYMPIFLMLLALFFVGIVGFINNRVILLRQLEEHTLHLAEHTSAYIDKYIENKDIVLNTMEDKLTIAGRMILENKHQIDNDYLEKMAHDFGIEEIYYYTPEGKVIYSSTGKYIGWQAYPEDPIFSFMSGNKNEFHEGIRKGTETDDYYKFSYFKDPEGYIVKVGLKAEDVLAVTDQYDFQHIITDILQNKDILYALIVDKNLITVADSRAPKIEKDYTLNYQYQEALKGNSSAIERYSERVGEKVVEATVPLVIDGEVIGVLAIGHSLASLDHINLIMILSLLTLSGFIIIICLRIHKKYIASPISNLNNDMQNLKVENGTGLSLPISKDNPFLGVYKIINNILKRIEEYISHINDLNKKLEYMAYHDVLTNLPNRRFLEGKLQEALNSNQTGALFLIDLDNMNAINDTLGHVYGDEVLKSVSKNLMQEKEKNVLISRLGGDEFMVLILGDANFIQLKLLSIIDRVKRPARIYDYSLEIDYCLGISLFPQDGTIVSELISKADIAANHVKSHFNQGYTYFQPIMLDRLKERDQIHKLLKQAVKNQGFKLLYQPIYQIKSGEVSGFEALLRLKDASTPAIRFIEIAEEKELISEIGRWVVNRVIRQLSEWKQKGINIKPIAVNLSPKQLRDQDFIQYLEKLLTEYQIDPAYLEIEITENVFVKNDEKTIVFLQKLRIMGIKVSLDDFGAGYSSLHYLTFMPVDKIKLDKAINDKFLNYRNYNIIKHIISLSHDLDLKIVAEGIESREQYQILQEINCDFIQGYLFSEPVEAETAEEILKKSLRQKIV
jgi:diguanylate cyclase (GGDEF)-like protein